MTDDATLESASSAALAARVLKARTSAELETIIDDLESREWELMKRLRSQASSDDPASRSSSESTLNVLSDVLAAMAVLTEDNASEVGGVLWNLAGFLSEAGRFPEAANTFVRAGFMLRMGTEAMRSGRAEGDAEDEEAWAETAFLHACRDYLAADYVLAAAAVVRVMHADDLVEEARSLLTARLKL